MAVTSKLGLYLPQGTDLADVQTMINDQLQKIDDNITVQFVTNATLPASPFLGKVIYNTDTKELRYWSGSAWIFICSPKDAWGVRSFQKNETAGPDVGYNQEKGSAANNSLPFITCTFNQIKNRIYRVAYSVQTDSSSATDYGGSKINLRYKFGNSVDVADPVLYWQYADMQKNGTTFSVDHVGGFAYTADRTSQISIGMYLTRYENTAFTLHFVAGANNIMFVEDVGLAP